MRPLSRPFDPPSSLDVSGSLSGRFADAEYRWRVRLRIDASRSHVRRHIPASVVRLERLEPPPDGAKADARSWHRAELQVESVEWLPPVLAALGCEVLIDEPAEVRDHADEAAHRVQRAAGAEGVDGADGPAASVNRGEGRRVDATQRTGAEPWTRTASEHARS